MTKKQQQQAVQIVQRSLTEALAALSQANWCAHYGNPEGITTHGLAALRHLQVALDISGVQYPLERGLFTTENYQGSTPLPDKLKV